ncbi:hypothetical protein ACFLT9_13935 [Acidobacteriota bacterium]
MREIFRSKPRGFLVALSVCVFLSSLPVHSLMIRLPLRTLVNEAEVILLGEVRDIRSDWSMDRRLILTTASIRIKEVWKGRVDFHDVMVQYPGGQVGDISLRVSDVPEFRLGETAVVFLQTIPDPAHPRNTVRAALSAAPVFSVYGKAQGKYSIGGDDMARKAGYTLLRGEPDAEAVLPLRFLKSRVKDFLRRPAHLKIGGKR